MRPASFGEGRPTLVISTSAIPLDMSEVVRRATTLACNSVEIAVDSDDVAIDCNEIRAALATHNLKCAGLSLNPSDTILGAIDAGQRSKARERIGSAIQEAVRLDASYVRMVAAQLDTPSAPRCAEASHPVLEAFLALRHEAGLSAVRIVLHVADHEFLVSPTEARRFLDAVNSPWVGASLDLDSCVSTASAMDWIETLTHRLAVVRMGRSQNTNLDWPAVGRALAAERFDGIIVSPMTASRDIDNSLIEMQARLASPVPPV